MKKKIINQYISQIKSFFPIITKQEKNFLNTLQKQIELFCEEESVDTIEELYHEFGGPQETVSTYYSHLDTDTLIHHIQLNRRIRRLIFSFSVIILITFCTIFSIKLYNFATFYHDRATTIEMEITDN